MLGAIKNRCVSSLLHPQLKLGFNRSLSSLNKIDLISSLITDNNENATCATAGEERKDILSLPEVEKILRDVGADNVKVIPVQNESFTDHVVLATGRSAWHVRNIAQALFYKAKLKQRGGEKKLLPTVEGQKGGKWIVVDSGSLVIHALDEKMRAYYNLDALWTEEKSMKLTSEESQDEIVESGLVKEEDNVLMIMMHRIRKHTAANWELKYRIMYHVIWMQCMCHVCGHDKTPLYSFLQ